MSEIIGYHGTEKRNKTSIDLCGFKLSFVKKKPDHWLGLGIYFFEQKEYAKTWILDYLKEKCGCIYKCDIKNSKAVDLDNPIYLDKFNKYCKDNYCNIMDLGVNIDNEKVLRALFIEMFCRDFNYNVVLKTFTIKPKRFYSFDKLNNLPYVQKQICVYDESIIRIVDCEIFDIERR